MSSKECIKQLKKLTPTLGDMVINKDNGDKWVEIKSGEGTVFMFNLLRSSTVAIAKAFLSAGATIEEHVHPDEQEWLIVYEGEMDFILGQQKQKYFVGEYVHIAEGILHSASFPKDTWLLAITMPPAAGYPK